jgi:hypothetical protein
MNHEQKDPRTAYSPGAAVMIVLDRIEYIFQDFCCQMQEITPDEIVFESLRKVVRFNDLVVPDRGDVKVPSHRKPLRKQWSPFHHH